MFGSRARGNHLRSSDYDIMLVSKKFDKYDFRERIIKVLELLDKPLNVEVLCYTPEEFESKRKELCMVRESAEQGIPLFV